MTRNALWDRVQGQISVDCVTAVVDEKKYNDLTWLARNKGAQSSTPHKDNSWLVSL